MENGMRRIMTGITFRKIRPFDAATKIANHVNGGRLPIDAGSMGAIRMDINK
jgi:hypothetical protein